jgi:arylsulfatase B
MLVKKQLIGCLSILALWGQVSFVNATEQPNILLIVGDDHGHADMGVTGNAKDVKTPNLDALASSGLRFTQAYATSPICSTSRAGLITGSYTQRFGGYWYGGDGLKDAAFSTLPEQLKMNGYSTGYVGKWHYGSDLSPSHRNFPLRHGFDNLYGFSGGRKHYLIHNAEAAAEYKERVQKAAKKNRKAAGGYGQGLANGPVWINEQLVDQEGFSTELIGEQASKFLANHQKQSTNKPFFLQVSFNAIHNFTHQLPKKYLDNMGLKGMHDWQPEVESYSDWYEKGRYPNNPEGRAYYLGQLSYLDKEVGNIMATLKEQGLAENTLVIYIGDNGGSTPIYANNGPLRGSKYTLYEGGIRVPMIVHWPDKYPEAKVLDNVVSAMDLYPTILQTAGAEIPSYIDGVDLSTLLNAQTPELSHELLFWDSGHEAAVREGKWKYHWAKDDLYAVKQHVELDLGEFLYDLEKDPSESINLASRHPEIINRLKAKYRQWAKNNIAPSQLNTKKVKNKTNMDKTAKKNRKTKS